MQKQGILYCYKHMLVEWKKYKVSSFSDKVKFKEEDFIKIGEFGTDNYGTLVFKNCIGIAFFRDIKIQIESHKISAEELEVMSETVNRFISNLSYDFNEPTYSRVSRSRKQISDLDYHMYLLMMNLMRSSNKAVNIFANFKFIENDPHRQMISNMEYESVHTASNITSDAIADVFSGNTSIIPCNNTKNKLGQRITDRTKNYLPAEMCVEEITDTYDNNENRFIKYFISICLSTIEKFQEKFKRQKDFLNKALIEENRKYSGQLKNILANSFLKEVGSMQSIPMYSTILTRRDGYRQLFNTYLGLKSTPVNAFDKDDLAELIENKSIDVLYENYCYFSIAQVFSEIYSECLDTKKYKVYKTEFSKRLEKKTNSNYFVFEATEELPKVRLNYNKNYNNTYSYSKSFDPDISLEIIDSKGEIRAIYLFDAKFKANIYSITSEDEIDETETKKIFKYDDISKMHTYKDAIKLARGAFILYPGNEEKIFYEDSAIPEDEYQGVGAFGLRPDSTEDIVRKKVILLKILKANRQRILETEA